VSATGGLFWGIHVATNGQTTTPRTVWVSLGLAVGFGVAGALLPWDGEPRSWSPRRWPGSRWTALALSSLAVALGVIIGSEAA
jgi:hypothetical protein